MAASEKYLFQSFVFHVKWRDILLEYPEDVRHEVFDAIIDYAATGRTKDLKPLAKMAFSFIRFDIDRDQDRYAEKVEKCRAAARIGVQKVRKTADGRKTAAAPDASGPYEVYPGVDENAFIDIFFAPNRRQTIDGICSMFRLEETALISLARFCVLEWKASDHRHPDFNEAARHLLSHMRRKNADSRKRKDSDTSRASLLQSAGADLAEAISESQKSAAHSEAPRELVIKSATS